METIFDSQQDGLQNIKLTKIHLYEHYASLFFDVNHNLVFYFGEYQDIDYYVRGEMVKKTISNEKCDEALTRLKHFITTEETP